MPARRNTGKNPVQGKRTPARGTGKKAKVPNSSARMNPGQSKPEPKVQKYGFDTPCPSRGPHDSKCLCQGTGTIKTVR